jgi:N-acetylglutamate synthase-like GNAT family acetyltransferase
VTDQLERLGPDQLDAIVSLVDRALPAEGLARPELAKALFCAEQPAVVRGDPTVGVVATVRSRTDDRQGFLRLLAVDPDRRGRGAGRALLDAAEADLADAASITVGADAPFHLFAGVPVECTAMLALLEGAKYRRGEANVDMRVDLTALEPPPGVTELAPAAAADEVRAFVDANYAHWTDEVMRALDQESLVVSRDGDGALLGFCALEVNRAGLLGPVAVRLDRIGHGDGRPLLLGGLHELARRGRDHVDVGWVGPLPPYAAVGGHISRVYLVYRKEVG